MEIIAEITLAILFAAGIIALIWSIRGVMLLPVKLPKGEKAVTLLRIKGSMPQLEDAVEGLLWLHKNGTINMEIVLLDLGMDKETARVAAILEEEKSIVRLCKAADLENVLVSRK